MTNGLEHHHQLGARYTAERQAALDAKYLAEHGDTQWKINNSTWNEYAEGVYFPGLGQTLDEVVVNLDCDSSVGLDIAGGNGTAMLDLIHRGVLSSAAVTNFDDRPDSDDGSEDTLTYLSGNLLFPAAWRKIISWRRMAAPSGLKLISHMPRDTLQWQSPEEYATAAHASVNMLAGGGALTPQIAKSLARQEQSRLFRGLEKRDDVIGVFTSTKHSGYHHALILKAA